MALRFVDSFDHYVTADVPNKYDNTGGSVSIDSTNRHGGQSLRAGESITTQFATKVLDAQATWIVGFALNISTFAASDKEIMDILDGSTAHLTLFYQASSQKLYVSGAWGTAVGTTVLSTGTWYYVEVKVTIADSPGGSYELRINTNTEASASGVDTRNGGNASADRIRLRAGSAGTSGTSTPRYFDDYYICDGTGSTNNDFLGDIRVEALYPNGNGNSSQFTGSDGNSTDNYLLVDEATANGDTDYVQDDTISHEDTYAMADLTLTAGTVFGVQGTPYVRAADAGTRKIISIGRLSGTEADFSAERTLSQSYLFLHSISETKPGGGAWTVSDVNSAEFGYRVTL